MSVCVLCALITIDIKPLNRWWLYRDTTTIRRCCHEIVIVDLGQIFDLNYPHIDSVPYRRWLYGANGRLVYCLYLRFHSCLIGDENWGGKCEKGRRQSPVDLAVDASIVGQYPSLMLGNYTEIIENAAVINTGHSGRILLLCPNRHSYRYRKVLPIMKLVSTVNIFKCSTNQCRHNQAEIRDVWRWFARHI